MSERGRTKHKTLGAFFDNRRERGAPGLPIMSVTLNDGMTRREELDRRTETGLSPQEHLRVRKGDIAYNMMRMWQGACGLAHQDGIVSPAYVVLRPNDKIDSRFAYHWFKSDRMIHYFWAYSHGLTADRLRLYFDDFCQIPAVPPPVAIQVEAADTLDLWDCAIRSTAALVAKNVRLRRVLHSRLFPPPSYADRSAAGWAIVRLRELIASIEAGVSVNSEDRQKGDGEIGILKTSCVSEGTFRSLEHKAILANERARVRTFAQRDCTIVSRMNTPDLVGESGYVPEDYPDLFLPDRLWQLKPRDEINGRWLSLVIASPTFRQAMSRAATGTSGSMKNISQDALLDIEVVRPTSVEQQQLAGLFSAWDRGIETSESLIVALETQKHGLMQRLVAGEWWLPDLGQAAPPRTWAAE